MVARIGVVAAKADGNAVIKGSGENLRLGSFDRASYYPPWPARVLRRYGFGKDRLDEPRRRLPLLVEKPEERKDRQQDRKGDYPHMSPRNLPQPPPERRAG